VQRNKQQHQQQQQQQQQHEAATATQAANNSINTNNQPENRAKVAFAFGPCPANHAPSPHGRPFSPGRKPLRASFSGHFFGCSPTVPRQCKCMILDYLEGKIKFKLK